MKRVAVYLGNTKRKADRDRMAEAVREYCGSHEMDIIRWLDQGEFGSIGDVAYGNWLNGRKVDAVVVPEAKVVSGNVYEFYAYKAVLKRRHSDLVIAKDGVQFPGHELYLKLFDELLDTMCRIDVANDPIKSNFGRIDKAARGAYIGGRAPMGYKVEDGKLVLNPEEVPIVEFVFSQKRTGKTMLGTVGELNAKGYKTRYGKPFVISTVQSIWNNEMFYKGYYRYGKDGEWVKGQHEAILKY